MFLSAQQQMDIIPQKIISLVPSITELLYDLGLEERVIAITKFCVHPPQWHSTKQRIGGTKNLNLQKIISLKPDLIIANKEENTKDQIETLAASFSVLLTDVVTYENALLMIRNIGAITGCQQKADRIESRICREFEEPEKKNFSMGSAVYFIWNDPYLVAGGDTFISSMLYKAGFKNLMKDEQRYPVLSMEKLIEIKPEFVLLSSEPFPFKDKHAAYLQQHLPESNIVLVDGEMFSWYGSHMLQAAPYFKKLQQQLMQQ